MDITYCNDKDVACYRDYVLHPDDRKASRAFAKRFGKELMAPAERLHERLKTCVSAGEYNVKFGQTKNCIEKMQGCRDGDPLVLKVRVSLKVRKFFYHMLAGSDPLLMRDWQGDFGSVTAIHVVAVNHHEYSKV